jgi:hypothetical protein
MTNRFGIRTALAALAALALCAPAQAQLFRAYLASDGSDANPCTLSQPCRLMPAALAAVADGGQIWMLDSANYNTSPVVIAKSVSILAVPGAVGSLVAFPFAAVQISTGVSVSLRNLVIGAASRRWRRGRRRHQRGQPFGGALRDRESRRQRHRCERDGGGARVRDHHSPELGRRPDLSRGRTRHGGARLRGGNGGVAIMGYGEATGHTIVDITDSVVEGSFSGINGSSQQFAASVTMTVANSQIVRNQYGVLAKPSFPAP